MLDQSYVTFSTAYLATTLFMYEVNTSMYKVMKTFICRGCVIPVTGTGCTSVDIGVNVNLELVDKFCYLGDMLSVDGDADAAV